MTPSFIFLPHSWGRGTAKRWRGRQPVWSLGLAPSTTLRAVPLPRFGGEERTA